MAVRFGPGAEIKKGIAVNIGVIGGSRCSKRIYQAAYTIGRLIAEEGWILICGGHGGVMEAACKGAQSKRGITVGILPSAEGRDANKYLTVKIPTGLGYARNFLVVRASKVLVAIDGKYGTLSEISFALNEGKTVVGIETWDIEGIVKVNTPSEAIEKIKRMFRR